MTVVDANVVVLALIGGASPESAAAAAALTTVAELNVPAHFTSEVMGAIRWHAAGARIAWDDAEAAITGLSELGALSHLPSRSDIDRAWELRHNVTPQDGLYVALAERLDEPFITGDLKLSRCDQLRCAVVALSNLS